VFTARRVELRYRSAGASRAVRRTLDPVGLVAKGGTWYLVALHRGEPRLFRADRVVGVEVREDAVPADLPELAGTWAELRDRVDRPEVATVTARLRVAASDSGLLLRLVDAQLADEPEVVDVGEGFQEITATFRALGAARGVLLGLGPLVHVLEPPELVADLVRTARDVLERYGPQA
jgi:predicted DNA-binding transcriptional regulator YafY